MMQQKRRGWIIAAAVVIVLGVTAYIYFSPKRIAVEQAVPAGALVFARLDHVEEHLKSLRSSQFWQNASKIDIPKFLEHEKIESQKVEDYNEWRSNVVGVLDNPVFKQYFGREVAAALYPPVDGFSNGNWPKEFSGFLLITRPDPKTRVAESLAGIWNQYSKEWETQVSQYKNIAVTAVTLEQPKPTVYYAHISGLLVAAVDVKIIHAVIDTVKGEKGPIEKDARFVSLRQRLYDSPDGIFFLDVPGVVDFAGRYGDALAQENKNAEAGPAGQKIQDAFKQLGGIQVYGGAFTAGNPIRSKWVLTFDPAGMDPEIKKMYGCAASLNATAQIVPKDTVFYQWMNCFDFPGSYEKVLAMGREKSEASPFAELEETWGLSVKDDILPVLGDEVGWFVQGIEVGGLFPVPKLVLFIKIKDEKAADGILRKIVTTPFTILQTEEYKQSKVNFVSIPLTSSFRPSYAFLKGYLLIATSDALIKQGIDTVEDPAQGLAAQAFYKEMGNQKEQTANAVTFIKIGEIAQQSRSLVGWADNWFSVKVSQADADEEAARQKWQALKDKTLAGQQALAAAQERLSVLRKEQESLQAQAQASAVVTEAKGALAQEGAVQAVPPSENQPEQALKLKRSQVEAAQSEVFGIQKNIESLKNQQPELEDALDDFEKQKADTLKFRYYVDDVVAPVLKGLESLTAQGMVTTFKDGAVESEMFLKVQ